MKILLLNQYFWPDHSAVAQLASELAEDLVVAGHDVTVVAARGRYLGGAALPARETWRGVEIRRVGTTTFGKGSLAGRVVDYLSFFAAAAARALLLPRFDVIVATSAPPLVASLGAALAAAKGGRLLYWLQDVYPELAVEFGVLRRGSSGWRLLEWVSRLTMQRADAVVVLGEAMAARVVAKGVDSRRIHVIPNWADGRQVRPVAREANTFRGEHGLAERIVVLYSGNMGRAHDMATLLQAAGRLQGEPRFAFVFIGDGAKRPEVEEAAASLPSIRLLPYQPRERLQESLSAADVHVVTQAPSTLGLMEPSKLYGVLAAGRPVLYIGPAESEAARTVRDEEVGEVVACGDPAGAAAALVTLAARSAVYGERARAAFLRSYDRGHRTASFAALLARLPRR